MDEAQKSRKKTNLYCVLLQRVKENEIWKKKKNATRFWLFLSLQIGRSFSSAGMQKPEWGWGVNAEEKVKLWLQAICARVRLWGKKGTRLTPQNSLKGQSQGLSFIGTRPSAAFQSLSEFNFWWEALPWLLMMWIPGPGHDFPSCYPSPLASNYVRTHTPTPCICADLSIPGIDSGNDQGLVPNWAKLYPAQEKTAYKSHLFG